MNQFQWKPTPKPAPKTVAQLEKSLGIDPLICSLLAQRNINTFDEAKTFFRPSLNSIHNPFLMRDMDVAVQRIERAIAKNENILIYGDYDVDGTTAVSLVYQYFSEIYPNLGTYIPDRYTEGYGISTQGIDFAHDNDVQLIIALDCGIKAVDKIEYANQKGIDFIICDHHTPGNKIPEAVAVLDPKRKDCNYPYDGLSGCGVGFKLVQAFHEKQGKNFDELMPLLDLLAISIGADIVPITGENRVLAFYGLKQLNTNPRPGLDAIIQAANKTFFNITNVVFIIGPRINAAGRIDHGKLAVELLTCQDTHRALLLAEEIDAHNKTRKDLDRGITEEALKIAATTPEKLTTVVYKKDWHKGVIGIVASRLIETHYKPTVVLTKSGDNWAGSARSVSGFDLYAALEKCTDELEQFGGHKAAAGMTIKEENLEKFAEAFEKSVQELITEDQKKPVLFYDQEIELNALTAKFYRILRQFEPFGPGNLSPLFLTRNVRDSGWAKGVGTEKDHLKFTATQAGSDAKISGIAFGFGHLAEQLKAGKPFDMVYHLEENIWNGQTSLQLMVKDIKLQEA